MTRRINKKILLIQIVINLALSSGLVVLLWYCRGFIEGVWFEVGLVLAAPTFYLLVLLKGVTYTMHFVPDLIFKLISFVLYVLITAVLQFGIYKLKKKL